MNRKDRRAAESSSKEHARAAPGGLQGAPQAAPITQLFATARSHHRAGQLPQAETLAAS
jgi:hypothetical protein